MYKIKFPVSYCIGVYNEEKILLSSLAKLVDQLDRIIDKKRYEIIIVENGSIDKTRQMLKKIRSKKVKTFYINKRALGLAIHKAILNARYDALFFGAIDLPFGFDDLIQASKKWEDFDLVYGSKGHRDSKVPRTLKRKIFSAFYNPFLKSLFDIDVKDTHGTLLFKKEKIFPILKYCNSSDAFFFSQLCIYAKLFRLRISEIPVKLSKEIRPSKFKILDGLGMFLSTLGEYAKYRRIKKKINSSELQKLKRRMDDE